MKITWKITLFSSLVVSAVVLTLFYTFYVASTKAMVEAQEKHIATMARRLYERGWIPALRRFYISINGEVVNDPYGVRLEEREGLQQMNDDYYIGTILRRPEKRIFLAVQVTPLVEGFQSMSKRAFVLSMIGIMLAVVSSFAIAHYSLWPLRELLKEISSIDASSLQKRVRVMGSGDEIDSLAKAINGMLERIEKAYKAQERFVHDVSHELRNPLTSLKGFVGVLKKWGKKSEEIFDESVSEIEEVVDEMKDLVEKLLMMARLEVPEMKSLNIREIVEEVVERLKSEYHGQDISVEGDARVKASPEYMKMIVRNLLENALKYTEGRVWVRIAPNFLEVADEGEGIPEDLKEKIFERFFRMDSSRDRRKGGHGIGLSLVKELAERMGMRVELESEPGKGSKFRVVWGDEA